MTILQALDRYYDRMAARGEAERPASRARRSASPSSVGGWRTDRHDRPQASERQAAGAVLQEVPAAVRRTVAISPQPSLGQDRLCAWSDCRRRQDAPSRSTQAFRGIASRAARWDATIRD